MLMPSSAAVCLLALPSAINWSTSNSRELRRATFFRSGSASAGDLLIVQPLGNGGAEKGVSVLHFPNRLGQIVGGGLFEQKSHRADRDRLLDVRVIAVRGENEHLGAGNGFANLPRGFQPIEQRHRDVHHDHRGAKFLGQCHRLAAGLRFADHLDIGFGLQQLPKPLADDHVVFSQQDSDAFHKY